MKRIIQNGKVVGLKCSDKLERITPHMIKDYKDLRFIATPSTAINHIEVVSVKIISLNDDKQKLKNVYATAEHTLMLMLNLLKNKSNRKNGILGNELHNKKVGIIGYGRIGKQVHDLLYPFSCSVSYIDKRYEDNNPVIIYKPYRVSEHISSFDIDYIEGLTNILKTCDILTMHVSAIKENQNLIDRFCLDRMKNKPYIINTCRDFIINNKEVLEHLRKDKLRGFATDFVVTDDLRYRNLNLIQTNHLGGYTQESRMKTDKILDQLISQELFRIERGGL